MRRFKHALFAQVLLAVTVPLQSQAQQFPFTISVLESEPTAIDLSYLNEKPAGVSGYLKAEGEHLVTATGKKVRLYGTNFCGAACFPSADEAVKVAKHLAKNGVNVVRLHHMDNGWGKSIIADNAKTVLDTDSLAKLDLLVAEFIKNGIYVNVNLHVSRTYEGTPESGPSFSKGLDLFHPPFIEGFKEYARQLLNHVNPHTGCAYKEEPGVALVEMNNENTLVLSPWIMADWKEPFRSEIQALFSKHLHSQYKTTEKLREAWGMNDGKQGPNLIANGDFSKGKEGWVDEAAYGSKAELSPVEGGIRWTSTQAGSESWSLQFSQPGLVLDEGKAYRLRFRARSVGSAQISVHGQNAGLPWAQLGFSEKVKLTPEWQTFSFDFLPHSVLPEGKNRIVFGLLNQVTTIDLGSVELCEISTGYLLPDQTLEAGNVPLPRESAKLTVRRDFFDFIIQLELEHALEMKRFLREEIGVKQLISHSQVLFGGIAGAWREFKVSDVVDTHGYWHHPHFPNKSWDMNDWTINNVSQLKSVDGGTLAEMAMQRPVGKPYSVSEFDVPAPNDFAAETFPLMAAMACLQDWSAVYHFNFRNGFPYDSDRISGFFDLPGHPGKQAFVPLAALIYRQELIPTHTSKRLLTGGKTGVVEYLTEKSGNVWSSWRELWQRHGKSSGQLAWQTQVGYDLTDDSQRTWGNRLEQKAPLQQGSATFDSELGSFHSQSDKCLILSGAEDVTSGAVQIDFSEGSRGTVIAVALDDQPLASSKKIWLCALNRAENLEMGWDAERRTVGKNWGKGPAQVYGVKATVKLGTAATVLALSPTGATQSKLGDHLQEFPIDPSQKTVWWLITR